MCFLHNLHRPKWAASQISLSLSTCGLSTAQWSVTTAVNMHAIPTINTKMAIFILVRLCIFPAGIGFCSVLFVWQPQVRSTPLSNVDTDLKPRDLSPRWLLQASHKAASSFLSRPRTSVFSPTVADLCAYGSKGRGPVSSVLLSCPSFLTHTLWAAGPLTGCKLGVSCWGRSEKLMTGVSTVVGNGCVSWGVVCYKCDWWVNSSGTVPIWLQRQSDEISNVQF